MILQYSKDSVEAATAGVFFANHHLFLADQPLPDDPVYNCASLVILPGKVAPDPQCTSLVLQLWSVGNGLSLRCVTSFGDRQPMSYCLTSYSERHTRTLKMKWWKTEIKNGCLQSFADKLSEKIRAERQQAESGYVFFFPGLVRSIFLQLSNRPQNAICFLLSTIRARPVYMDGHLLCSVD